MFSIPYFGGFEFGIFKEYSYGLQLPTHLYFYNKTHIASLLKDFENIRYEFQPADKDLTEPLVYVAAEKQHPTLARIARNRWARLALFRPLSLVLAALGRSSRRHGQSYEAVYIRRCKALRTRRLSRTASLFRLPRNR